MLRILCGIAITIFALEVSAQKNIDLIYERDEAVKVELRIKEHYPDSADSVLFFKVYSEGSSTPVIGTGSVTKDIYVFTPLWSFAPGMRYRIVRKDQSLGEFTVPLRTGSHPTVEIYPSQDTIPENLLKLYLVFSEPMSEGRSLDYLHILHKGDTLQGVFLELQPELWNDDRTQLTVWLDPGRIKRDLLKNKEMGVPIHSFNNYDVTVSSGWKSKRGIDLGEDVKKHYYTTEADRTKPDYRKWRLTQPFSGTRDALVMNFGEPLDYSLASSVLQIIYNGAILPGKSMLTEGERIWRFIPNKEWNEGQYVIVIESRLEDLAGNNLIRLFDTDLEKTESSVSKEGKDITITFEVKQRKSK